MKKHFHSFLALSFISVAIVSCTSDKESEGGEITDTTAKEQTTDTNRLAATQQIMYSIPSPAETADILKNAGTTYDVKLMNDVNNTDKYNVVKNQALNLGIFGTDLSYANVFEKSMEVQLYMESCQSLVNKLGIDAAISETVWERLENNKDDRDSLNSIISEVFFDLDTYLEENDKTEISGLIVAGGWIEGLYIATQMANEKKINQKLLDRIAEQKLSLQNLTKLMESYKETENIKDVRADLTTISTIYDKIEIKHESGESSTSKEGVTTIGGKNTINFPVEVLVELKSAVKKIRDAYVKP